MGVYPTKGFLIISRQNAHPSAYQHIFKNFPILLHMPKLANIYANFNMKQKYCGKDCT